MRHIPSALYRRRNESLEADDGCQFVPLAHHRVPLLCADSVGFLLLLSEAGCRQVQDLELPSVEVDPCGDAQAAAEGAVLGLYEYDDLKQKKKVAVSAKLHGR